MSVGRRAARQTMRWQPVVVGAAFALAMVAIGAGAAWPIYRSAPFVILVVLSFVVALGISVVGLVRRWNWLTIGLTGVAAYLVMGVPLAVPTALGGGAELASGWIQLVRTSVFGWKQLITITIPVGDYQGLLVPALIVFFFGSLVGTSLALRSGRVVFLSVPVLLAVQLFGLAFGAGAADTISTAFLGTSLSGQFLLGVLSFLVAIAFLLWRVYSVRRSALLVSQRAAGVRQTRAGIGTLLRRVVLGVLVVALALGASVAATPAVSAARTREVLRTSIDPAIRIDKYTSPLTDYRSYFTNGRFTTPLLRVKGAIVPGTRIRLAVLSYYDGQVFRVTDPTGATPATASAFSRVPSSLAPSVSGAESTSMTVDVDSYSGVWMPTAGSLVRASFTGRNASTLTDDFFYNQSTSAGIELSGLTAGDSYRIDALVPTSTPSVAGIRPPTAPLGLVKPSLIPKALTTWVQSQNAGSGGTALATLVSRLRARGYLSHAITNATGTTTPAWEKALGSYVFEPSFAGQSEGRVATLFSDLTAKADSVPAGTANSGLVAAVGDDEQFSVASALIAESLGFPARVVVGFRLGEGAGTDSGDSIPACTAGVCRGENLTAWVEVQDSNSEWVPLDVTPQHSDPLSPIQNHEQDPQNLTDVVPKNATAQQPPTTNPTGDQGQKNVDHESGLDLGWLVAILQIVGISLLAVLVLCAPFLAILFAKVRRRNARMRARSAESRIVGGWDEYVDTALDFGKRAPANETRSELARSYGTPRGVVLATIADRAVFSEFAPAPLLGDQFWEMVDAERAHFARGLTRWQRFRAAISLRSFTHYLRAQVPKQNGAGTLGIGGLK